MKKVTILGLHNSMATTIFGPMDILNQAGRLWNGLNKTSHTPFFDVTIASVDGAPIRSVNRIEIMPHCSIDQVDHTDLIIIASATYIDEILERSSHLLDWIRHHYDRGAHVASICTGVFLLAETGLLDDKSATLHWGFADQFKTRYPKVALQQDRMFIDHGRLYCSAGVSAGMDLSLYLVEKFCGRQAARQSAKTMVLAMDRQTQMPYDCFLDVRDHGDPLVAKAQDWLKDNRTQTLEYDNLALTLKMSRRSLERRFKQATGMTPLSYLQKLRVEQAKQMLEDGTHTFNEITYAVGYEDISFFRKIFVRLTGLRPKEYQQKFAGYIDWNNLGYQDNT
ncbi:MAG: helix-turn-helix domain-containing protein [Bacteroidetes bacterium]|nr:helix-turn-helix domain-containing protein [Bacteroidota bacterium]